MVGFVYCACNGVVKFIFFFSFFSFFFQAEDGIRDHCVTGVQTCALPIFHTKLDLKRMHYFLSCKECLQ